MDYLIGYGMEIEFEVVWVSTPEQGAVAARFLEPREFTLTPTAKRRWSYARAWLYREVSSQSRAS